MTYYTQQTFHFYGTAAELHNEIRGDWIICPQYQKLKYKGKTLITWHPTTGLLLIQGSLEQTKFLYEHFHDRIMGQEKYQYRSKQDLEHFKFKGPVNTLDFLNDA